jgi:uncharacterized membrane protein
MSESQPPNPFSREASESPDGSDANPNHGSATPPSYQATGGKSPDQYPGDWPSYPASDPYGRPTTDPYAVPGESYSNPSANSRYAGPEAGFAPQPNPPYGDFGHSYGQSAGYDGTLYEANPYQPAFGAVTPYGAVPEVTPTEQHPQAALALILGILGTVLGMTCVVGGLVGIGGIVVGRRVRNEIDAAPTRYTGRSQAIGGIVTGIIGVSIFTLVTVLIVLLVIAGIASADL